MSMPAALRRPVQSPMARRALVLSGLAAGFWLAGSATSSAAADDVPPPTASVQDVADRAGGLLSPVTTAVAPVVAPVVEATVTPVAETLAPVGETLVRAVEPVLEPVLAPVLPVLDPVVAPVLPVLEPVLPPVIRDVVDPALTPTGVPVAAAVVDSSSVAAAPVPSSPAGEFADPVAPVRAAAADGAADRSGVVLEYVEGASTTVAAPVSGGNDVPVPGPALPAGAPAPAAVSLSSSADTQAADLPPAASLADLVALGAAADEARDAAADRALDPSFAPD